MLLGLFSSFSSVQDSRPWNNATHGTVVPPIPVNQSGNSLIDIPRSLSPKSRSCQVIIITITVLFRVNKTRKGLEKILSMLRNIEDMKTHEMLFASEI